MKNLKNFTIIPVELYVERDADRQLRQIVAEMGRPGYVLVARQMGKSNLLLNAKRSHSANGHCFVYVDVSNTFPNLREFFRNIIDVSINSANFGIETQIEVQNQREKTSKLPEHKEHEIELSLVLQRLSGKLVICLDEIDALTKTLYSDNVFSFIRSVYFSGRTNIPTFEKLTYLLSGVAEPTELIKNKDISPFNIGAKILLEDFSRDQINQFIAKAGIALSEILLDRVFYWTNGHPRLTWDILSLIEDMIIANKKVTVAEIDSIVADKYINSHDLPPVDSMRQISKKDREIRSALMAIHYNKSESIMSTVRTKLYLNGITRSPSDKIQLELKNRIIEHALSEEWLQSLPEETPSLIDIAYRAYHSNDYESAAALFKDLLQETGSHLGFATALGHCLYELKLYEQAVDILENDSVSVAKSPTAYLHSRNMLATCLMLLDKTDKAENYFEEIFKISNSINAHGYSIPSLINIAMIRSRNLVANSTLILESCQKAIELTVEVEEKGEILEQSTDIKIAALHLMQQAHQARNELEPAVAKLKSAINLASGGGKAELQISLASLVSHDVEKDSLYKDITDILDREDPPLLTARTMFSFELTKASYQSLIITLAKLKKPNYLRKSIGYINKKDNRDLIISTISEALSASITSEPQALSNLIPALAKELDNPAIFNMRIHLILVSAQISVENFSKELKPLLIEILQDSKYLLGGNELVAYYSCIRSLFLAEKFEEARNIFSILNAKVTKGEIMDSAHFGPGSIWMPIKSILALFYIGSEGNLAGSQFNAEVNSLKENLKSASTLLPLGALTSDIVSELSEYLDFFQRKPSKAINPHKKTVKIGRNELVTVKLKSGKIIKGKYKTILSYHSENEIDDVTPH